jgi:two-component system, chemotaxis family, protein-glutamate methylesterase/glutaminase
MQEKPIYDAIVIGASAGGLFATTRILKVLPADFPIPVIVVQHRSKDERDLLEEVTQVKCKLTIKQADEKETIKEGTVYFAPPNYHLLIEKDGTFSLSYDAPVNFSRPSIDVLFETAAEVYKNKLLGIILTGANKDGARGMKTIRQHGGTTIAQQPDTAEYAEMPQAAINTGYIQHIMPPDEIGWFLLCSVKTQ